MTERLVSQHGSMTPEEVGRRNLIAELRAGAVELEYDGQWRIDLKTVRDLIAVLEAVPHLQVQAGSVEHGVCNACGWEGDSEHDVCPKCGQDELNYFTPGSAPAPVQVDREALTETRNILGVTRSVHNSDGAMFAVHHLATVSTATESASGWTDREALCGAKLVWLYDEQWDVKVCTRCTRQAEQEAAKPPLLDRDEIQDAIHKALPSEVTWAECLPAATAVLALLSPEETK